MNDELEVTWKEAIMAYLRYFPRIDLGNRGKSPKPQSGYSISQTRLEQSISRIQV
jgi:hypothetical protein